MKQLEIDLRFNGRWRDEYVSILGGKERIIEGDVRCSAISVSELFCTLSKYKYQREIDYYDIRTSTKSTDQWWELMPPTNYSYAANWDVTLNVSKQNLLTGLDGTTGTFDGSTKIVWLDYQKNSTNIVWLNHQNNSEEIKKRTWTKQGR